MPGHDLSPKNYPMAWGDLDPGLIRGSLRPCTHIQIPNGIWIGSAVFLRRSRLRFAILRNGPLLSPL